MQSETPLKGFKVSPGLQQTHTGWPGRKLFRIISCCYFHYSYNNSLLPQSPLVRPTVRWVRYLKGGGGESTDIDFVKSKKVIDDFEQQQWVAVTSKSSRSGLGRGETFICSHYHYYHISRTLSLEFIMQPKLNLVMHSHCRSKVFMKI